MNEFNHVLRETPTWCSDPGEQPGPCRELLTILANAAADPGPLAQLVSERQRATPGQAHLAPCALSTRCSACYRAGHACAAHRAGAGAANAGRQVQFSPRRQAGLFRGEADLQCWASWTTLVKSARQQVQVDVQCAEGQLCFT